MTGVNESRRDIWQGVTMVGRPDNSNRLWSLAGNDSGVWGRMLGRSVERLLSIDRVNDIYDYARGAVNWRDFVARVLERLEVSVDVRDEDLRRIPRKGGAVLVSNHPFGAVEGLLLTSLVARFRPDVKLMANHLLSRVPELDGVLIHTNPFGGRAALGQNVLAVRQAVRHLKNGGVLVVFPAGEVSHLQLGRRQVADPQWKDGMARIVRMAKVPVVPMHVSGSNSALFQLAGLVHSRLRTAMLARELFKGTRRRVEVRIGLPVPWLNMQRVGGDRELTEYLRRRTDLLAHRQPRLSTASRNRVDPVVPPTTVASQEREIGALPLDQRLVDGRELVTYIAEGTQIPAVLREIGRLREISFRAENEGTGKSIDLDRFDSTYQHLVLWNKAQREVVGAYRLGLTDRILARQGLNGLYTTTLFEYGRPFLDRIGPAIELGRSFVRLEYQRSFMPLLALWHGIGEFVARNPAYRFLFGPVSVSNGYLPVSRELMRRYLLSRCGRSDLSQLVRPWRAPLEVPGAEGVEDFAHDLDELGSLVSSIEPDGKNLPVLVRQYLRLGGRFVSFNVDRIFNDAMDGLIVVDLLETEPRVLAKYMGDAGIRRFYDRHGATFPGQPRLAV